MAAPDLESAFPALRTGGCRITSPADPGYNCVAWAVQDSKRWWDPSREAGYYWPAGMPAVLSLPSITAVFSAFGFESSPGAGHEPGVDKLAIYANAQGSPTHVARQLMSGAWTSKLGGGEDIEHDALEGLEGELYGKVACVLCRGRAA